MTEPAFRLLDTGKLTAAQNMALDEIILEEVAAGRSRPTLRFLRFFPPAALVGRHQEVEREIRRDYCQQSGIGIGRRITGGGAIYFQTSALGWELFGSPGIWPFTGTFDVIMARLGQAAATSLAEFGVRAMYRPRNDIEVDGRKISGSGGIGLPGGYMFQGTLLIENEIELFLRALRVPVEKLRKREIESLKERVCFLSDLVQPTPPMPRIKAALVRAMTGELGLTFARAGLTATERRRLTERTGYFASPDWIQGPRRPQGSHWFWSTHQTEAGTLRVHMAVEPRGRRIRQILITGDYFCRPARFVLDLEAAIKGLPARPELLRHAVTEFHQGHDGEFIGMAPGEVAEAVVATAHRLDLLTWGLEPPEASNLFLINLEPDDLANGRPAWLLLPYCSKKVDCPFRSIPDCGRCGECEFDRMYDLAERRELVPVSIQSFEHLMTVLTGMETSPDRFFVGSCCEAFFAKHMREMIETGARGVLVNLDSTTCYDLGKGMEAYQGRFENKTDLDCGLIERLVDRFGAPH